MGSGASSSMTSLETQRYLQQLENMGLNDPMTMIGGGSLEDEFLQRQMQTPEYTKFKELYLSTMLGSAGSTEDRSGIGGLTGFHDRNYGIYGDAIGLEGGDYGPRSNADSRQYYGLGEGYDNIDSENIEDWLCTVVGCSSQAARESADRCFAAGITSVDSLLSKVERGMALDNSHDSPILDLLVLDGFQKRIIISNCMSRLNKASELSSLYNGGIKRMDYSSETAFEMLKMLDSAKQASNTINMANSLNIPISTMAISNNLNNSSRNIGSNRFNTIGFENAGLEDDLNFIDKLEKDAYGFDRIQVTDEVVSQWLPSISAPVLHFSDDGASVWRNGSVGFFPKALVLASSSITMMSVRMDRAPIRNNYFSIGVSSLESIGSDNGTGLFGDKPGSWGLISRRNDPNQKLEVWKEGQKKNVLEESLREGDMLSVLFDMTSYSCTFFLNDQVIYVFEDLLPLTSSYQRSRLNLNRGHQMAAQCVVGSVVCDDHCISIMPDYCREHFLSYFAAIGSPHRDLRSLTSPPTLIASRPNRREASISESGQEIASAALVSNFSVVGSSSNSRHNRERNIHLEQTLDLVDNVNQYDNIDNFYADLERQLIQPTFHDEENSSPETSFSNGNSEIQSEQPAAISRSLRAADPRVSNNADLRELIRASPATGGSNSISRVDRDSDSLENNRSTIISVRATPVPANFPRDNRSTLLAVPAPFRPHNSNIESNSSIPKSSSATVKPEKPADAGSESKSADNGSAGNPSCCICWEHDKCVVLLPCRHLCLCEGCGLANEGLVTACPMCRQPIEQRFKVFT